LCKRLRGRSLSVAPRILTKFCRPLVCLRPIVGPTGGGEKNWPRSISRACQGAKGLRPWDSAAPTPNHSRRRINTHSASQLSLAYAGDFAQPSHIGAENPPLRLPDEPDVRCDGSRIVATAVDAIVRRGFAGQQALRRGENEPGHRSVFTHRFAGQCPPRSCW
jgi:hypothetical protein